jgi:DNA-binding MarR family transcriptional regulator/GNAT superfamily N-acetyltransferase
MDVMQGLGALALGSSLKRLSDQLMQDGIKVYRDVGVEFQPRWFAVFHYLESQGPTSVMDLARGLGVSHPGINQVAKEMLAENLVAAYRDVQDKRRRVLALTSGGRALHKELEPVWREIRQVLQDLLDGSGNDCLGDLGRMEQALKQRGFHQRFLESRGKRNARIELLPYHPDFQSDFASLNEQWISHYFKLEDADRPALENPQGYIIDPGGEIVFARDVESRDILGTCALVIRDKFVGELAKMAVSPAARGRGIGELLGEYILNEGKKRGLRTVMLETNGILAPALSLYRKLGFVQKPFPYRSSYGRADVYMECSLG